MKTLSLRFLMLFFIISSISFSQEKKEFDNSKTKTVSEIFEYKEGVSDYLQISQIENLSTRNDLSNGQTNRNVAIIQQVGFGNNALTNTISASSNINYLQVGAKNFINSQNIVANTNEKVLQTGINNSLINFSFGNVSTSNLDVIQVGNNLKFEKFGSNAQTNALKFRMTGKNQTLFVRSF
ncbi:hypothetical protein [Winogradskyella ursingii]|uniref:hypothetical protein n=1 Tax=Winogradskyella ursingii TaxID=2686079 RepID=UPI0015C91C21|nr:hypothetical protein [Winogradskyella ursingii]